ncbi:hypothetical protein [Paenibacillus sp. J2TS4]|uniref:hypothetical protein n=1 Tax=Paenibacillus sp. J2TS4 TaxID=2807194 RepID=UPI001B1B3B8C|nr:hypothetical protein [Paenibacillus sp. J2TS4]GIP33504.1 hypothetical protein J2TS4_27140 [Paenibacillus sp. J2TS4]
MCINFGKYDIPPTLEKLIDFKKEIGGSEPFYNALNFYLVRDENFRYFNTPSDVIIFGNIGVDGIHYGFLTDYGSADRLEAAPIVCVSPMDFDCPTKIVAGSLREFLRVNLTDGALFYNWFQSEEDYIATKRRWAEEAANSPYRPSEAEEKVRQDIIRRLMEVIPMPEIDNPYRYVQEIGLQRQKQITFQTQDGLGVIARLEEGEKHVPFPVDKNLAPDLDRLRDFLDTAPKASKLALFRDIQLNYILRDDEPLCSIVTEEMIKMGLADEAARIAEMG